MVMKMKKIKNISAVLSVIFALPAISIFLIEKYTDFEFLIKEIDSNILVGILTALACVFLLITGIMAIILKNEKHLIISTVIRIMCICILCGIALTSSFDHSNSRYYEFTSPDNKHTVIAEEWSFLMGGGVVFYERVNPLFVRYKEGFSTDDGYRAISGGDYSVEWQDDTMSITLQNGNNIYKTVDIII